MKITERNLSEFTAQSYTLVKQLVPEADRQRLYQHAMERSKTASMRPDTRVPDTPAAFGDPHMESLLERLLRSIELVTQLQLFPTYSYFRVYKTGDVLPRHTDRPACEISVSVNLGYDAPASWPIWIEGPLGPSSISMEAGDAVVYRGIDCPHWREAFKGTSSVQVFLHYVDQHGEHVEWKFDKRQRLGTVPQNPIWIADHVWSAQTAGLLDFGTTGIKVQLNPFFVGVMKDLELGHLVPEIVQRATKELRISESQAELAILSFISQMEAKGLLAVN